MPTSQIRQFSASRLRSHPATANSHPKNQIAQIGRSIRQFAQHHGLELEPVVVQFGLSDAERRAYLLVDNKLVENASWDRAAVALELKELAPLFEDAGLDIHLTGFETAEIDALMGDLIDPEEDPADELLDIGRRPISRKGDLCPLVGIACGLPINRLRR